MDGKHSYEPDEYPSEEFREWRLTQLMNCSLTELDEQPAVRCDWLLQVDDTVAQFKADKQQEANRRNAG